MNDNMNEINDYFESIDPISVLLATGLFLHGDLRPWVLNWCFSLDYESCRTGDGAVLGFYGRGPCTREPFSGV